MSGSANRGQTVNSRRAQVRRERDQAINNAVRTGGTLGTVYAQLLSLNASRLAPNTGTWIRGGTSRPDGNYLYGAVMAELGIPQSITIASADFFEWADDLVDRSGLGDQPDESWGNADQQSRTQIRTGARCPG